MLALLAALALTAYDGDAIIRSQPGDVIQGDVGVQPLSNLQFYYAPLTTPGDWASGTTALVTVPAGGAAITNTRTSVATYENPPGTIVSVAAGRLRVEADGLVIERQATNFALNSATHPKAAEASASIPVGAVAAWHRGTGTLTIAAGTATLAGLACAGVAAGTVCYFSVTVAGTVLITTTAGTTHVQVEQITRAGLVSPAERTTDIVTGGTSATRTADQISAVISAPASGTYCADVTVKRYAGRAWTAAPFWTGTEDTILDVGDGNGFIALTINSAGNLQFYWQGTGGSANAGASRATIAGASARFTAGFDAPALWFDGANKGLSFGNRAPVSLVSPLHIGWSATVDGGRGNLYLKHIRLYRGGCSRVAGSPP